ncbi:hypothetical protein [Salinicoccus sp. HZC-1]|uniref:hypothetical protein n=1 Tax=Salinicoccus sp. HZC-1 TaxID=3385497 RepID=UPI00398AC568
MSAEHKNYEGTRQPDPSQNPETDSISEKDELMSLKGTFFSTVIFVGGAIVLWTGVLITLFLMRF